jgi:hypothetical protein
MAALRWNSQANFTALVRAGNQKLGFSVVQTDRDWTAIAIETTGDDVSAVLDAHAHQVVGKFENVSDAFDACEDYASKWRIGERADGCECEEITPPPAAPYAALDGLSADGRELTPFEGAKKKRPTGV